MTFMERIRPHHLIRPSTPGPTWRYRCIDQGIVEDLNGRVRLWGFWDKQFGCWDIDDITGERTPVDINWPLLNARGTWLSVDAWKSDFHAAWKGHQYWRHHASAAFAIFFSRIPLVVRRKAALEENHWVAMQKLFETELRNLQA